MGLQLVPFSTASSFNVVKSFIPSTNLACATPVHVRVLSIYDDI